MAIDIIIKAPPLRTDAVDFHTGQELVRQIVKRFNAHAALIEAAEAVCDAPDYWSMPIADLRAAIDAAKSA